MWTFNNKNTLSQFQAFSDSDHNEGFSKCELVMSPTGIINFSRYFNVIQDGSLIYFLPSSLGKGLFQGFVNTRPPKDGRVKYAGYCIMKSNDIVVSKAEKAFLRSKA